MTKLLYVNQTLFMEISQFVVVNLDTLQNQYSF